MKCPGGYKGKGGLTPLGEQAKDKDGTMVGRSEKSRPRGSPDPRQDLRNSPERGAGLKKAETRPPCAEAAEAEN